MINSTDRYIKHEKMNLEQNDIESNDGKSYNP